jgi:hypothetical protein
MESSFVLEIAIAAGSEALVERGGKNRPRYTGIDGCPMSYTSLPLKSTAVDIITQ